VLRIPWQVPRTDILRSGSSSERRDHAPVHPACPATLPPRSASVPAALGKPGLRPKYGQPKAGQPKAEHAHQRCVWPTSATYISKTSTRAVHGFRHSPDNRASPRCPIRFAPANPRNQDGYSPSQARKDRSSDVPVIQRNSTRNRASPNQRPVPPTTREDCGLPRPRTPSTSKQPSAGSSPAPRFREAGSRRHFTHGDHSPWARPPSPTSAATEVASLSPTPLADFCNQNRARAHRPSDWSSPAARFRASQCFRRLPSFGREQHEPGNRNPG